MLGLCEALGMSLGKSASVQESPLGMFWKSTGNVLQEDVEMKMELRGERFRKTEPRVQRA